MKKFLSALPLIMLASSCASTSMNASKTLTLQDTGTDSTRVEVSVIPSAKGFTKVRARVLSEAKDRLTSARFTFFEDVNGNGAFDEGDRKLSSCFGETGIPSQLIEVSGMNLSQVSPNQDTMLFAEIATIQGHETTVLPLKAVCNSL